MTQRRRMPTEHDIRMFWCNTLWYRKGFDSPEEFMEHGICFACGMSSPDGIERAHIEPRCNGGVDGIENLHMLCRVCHKDSEFLTGIVYMKWLLERSAIDMPISVGVQHGRNIWSLLIKEQQNDTARDD